MAMAASGLPVVVITPEWVDSLPVLGASADRAAAANMSRIAQACEQSMGMHHQLVFANGLMDAVREAVGPAPHRWFLQQESPFGGAEAVVSAVRSLSRTKATELYLLAADAPVTPQSIWLLRTKLRATGAAMVVLTRPVSGGTAKLPGLSRHDVTRRGLRSWPWCPNPISRVSQPVSVYRSERSTEASFDTLVTSCSAYDPQVLGPSAGVLRRSEAAWISCPVAQTTLSIGPLTWWKHCGSAGSWSERSR